MRSSDKVGALYKAVADQVQLSQSEIKVFRLGQEIQATEFNKPISQMRSSLLGVYYIL